MVMAESDSEYVEYVTAHLAGLRRLGYHLCGTTAEADDLVQETITRLFVHWRRVRTVANLDGYVRSMLVRTFLTERRRPWARVGRFAEPPPATATTEPEPELRVVLSAALARLPRRQRAVLVLRFLHDLPVEEVARHLNCAPGTVKSQTSHGLTTLRRLLSTRAFAWTESDMT
jgi:RNA polymerase sigma-70 factor (sigma-E family)